jgi:superfamily I DNA/RNA helicase
MPWNSGLQGTALNIASYPGTPLTSSVTVVGDEDQSIYSFRYAHPEGIVEYPLTHPQTHDELLDVCRRCPRRVVEIANALISQNQRLAVFAPVFQVPRP